MFSAAKKAISKASSKVLHDSAAQELPDADGDLFSDAHEVGGPAGSGGCAEGMAGAGIVQPPLAATHLPQRAIRSAD